MKIGIVEDSPLMIEIYKHSLDEFECVLEAHNGYELIQKFNGIKKKNIPDLLIVDIHMPIMDGFETVEWLKLNYPNIKIIVASVTDSTNTILRMIKLGVNGYVMKDRMTSSEIKQAVSEISEKGTYYTKYVSELVIRSYQNSNLTDVELKIQSLTEKEITIIKCISDEMTTFEICERLSLSPRTIENFVQKILSKLGVKTRIGIALFAERNGLLN